MERKPCPPNLSEAQWKLIEPQIPPEQWGGRTRQVDMREIFNGMMYLTRTGCQWRAIPHDLPNKNTIRHYYDRFRKDGTWEKVHDMLREKVHVSAGKESAPSAGIIDSQCGGPALPRW
jgi:putative transposase